MTNKQLFEIAKESLKNSYAPYSNFSVAAAILMNDGKVITGVNVENASYGGTICAERSALVSAISQGYKKGDFQKILICSINEKPISPCGICRQFISEFFNENNTVLLAAINGEIIETNICELLPYSFQKEDLL